MERSKFEDTLVNNQVIQKFIESAFNGNVLILPPIDRDKAKQRFQVANYITNLNSNRPEVMKKIHKVSYPEIFSDKFVPEKIDTNLKHMEMDEKLFLLDNIIDYLYYNFKSLRGDHQQLNKTMQTSKSKAPIKRKMVYEQQLAITLLKKGIHPSLSLDFRKVVPIMVIGGAP